MAFALATNARAESPRVVLVHSGAGDPVTAHLVDELVALGFTVEIVPPGHYELAALARERHARAVVQVEPSRRGIALWTDNKHGVLKIEENPEEKGDLATLSLRAVEELRGQLLTGPVDSPVPTPDKPPTPPATEQRPAILPPDGSSPIAGPIRPSEPLRPRGLVEPSKPSGQLWLHVAPAAMVHPGSGGIGAGATALLGGRWMFLRRFGADLAVIVPVVPSTITSPVGNVNISASAVMLGAWIDVLRPVPTLVWGLGAGAGGGVFHHYGQPQASGVEARDGNVAYGLPYARTALTWSISPSLALRADVLAAMATPRPVLRLPGRTSDAYFGQPLLMIGLGLDLKLK